MIGPSTRVCRSKASVDEGGIKDLKVSIDNVDIAVVGDEAVVSYTRTDDFVDARTGRPMHVAVRLTKTLKQDQGAWKLAGGK
jgi:ketosteroid isomerase-like protein